MPTTFVHTSAGTLLPTTDLQSPRGALPTGPDSPSPPRRHPPTQQQQQGQGHYAYSFSAPCSPAGAAGPERRSLLYSRRPAAGGSSGGSGNATAGWGSGEYQLGPSNVELLDRLSLLRRVAPTTLPAPRPHPLQRHAAAVEHTAAPVYGTTTSSSGGGGGGIRWGTTALESPRPIATLPAPGWHYHGDCKASLHLLCGVVVSHCQVLLKGSEASCLSG